uniref:Uncharacterized protein n=1 Tax=viral metagenome TaxID=1070528 RepID=A0A6C0CAG3_9ZZZZ
MLLQRIMFAEELYVVFNGSLNVKCNVVTRIVFALHIQ